MAYSDGNPFPQAGKAFPVLCMFRNAAGAFVNNWTGATASIYVDGVLAGTQTPVEAPASSGVGMFTVPAGYTTNGHCVQVVASISNGTALPFGENYYLTDAPPVATPAAKPADMAGQIFWLFCYFYGGNDANNGADGPQIVLIPNGHTGTQNVLTSINFNANDLQITAQESTP